MHDLRPITLLFSLLLTLLPTPTEAQSSERWRAMNRPVEPLQMADNLYYVGANSVAAYLITTPEGHILIDGGFPETVPIITSGIEKLGFRLEDVKILLASHAHFDHVGGLAELKKLTGARLLVSEQDAPLLERGGLGDDLLGDIAPFPPVKVDQRLTDRDTVELGGTVLRAHVTAGHTRGCTSWEIPVTDGDETYTAVSICSLSLLEGMVLTGDEPTYPGIGADFAASIERLRSLPCDVFLASHAGFFDLAGKREAEGGVERFIDPQGYAEYLDRAENRLQEWLAREEAERSGTIEVGEPEAPSGS